MPLPYDAGEDIIEGNGKGFPLSRRNLF